MQCPLYRRLLHDVTHIMCRVGNLLASCIYQNSGAPIEKLHRWSDGSSPAYTPRTTHVALPDLWHTRRSTGFARSRQFNMRTSAVRLGALPVRGR